MKIVGSGQGALQIMFWMAYPRLPDCPVGITAGVLSQQFLMMNCSPRPLHPERYRFHQHPLPLLASVIFYFFAAAHEPLIHLVGARRRSPTGSNGRVTSESRQDEIGTLAGVHRMIQSLKDKAQIAQKIAGGDLTVEATSFSEVDALEPPSRRWWRRTPAGPGDPGGRQCPGIIGKRDHGFRVAIDRGRCRDLDAVSEPRPPWKRSNKPRS